MEKRFCEVLSEMLNTSKMSRVAFYTEVGIKKSYFYDIISGKVNPPPAEKQFAMIRVLKPKSEIRNEFFELAADERNEMPVDLARYIDEAMRKELRSKRGYKKMLNSILK